MKKQPENKPLIEEPPRWLCRTRTGPISFKKNEAGVRKVHAELIYGTESFDKEGIRTVAGSKHFALTGSTAEDSITAMAVKLNAEGRIPRDEVDECFADRAGWENVSRKNPQTVAIPLPVEANPALI